MSKNTTAKKTGVDKLIDGIEKVCNKLPPPAILFCWLFLITAIIGCIFSVMGVALTNPASGEVVTSANLFSKDGVDWILGNMVKNFTGFAPLGLVITMTLGIGLCEESGMLISMLNSSLKNVPAAMIPYVIAFVGTVGNIASDTAMVVIPPMAAIVYMGVGKHPVVGMMVGYAGAQAGFTANLMVAGTDTLLQGLTNDAIKAFIPDTTFQVDPTCNWFFMIFSTLLCAAVIGFCSVHMIEPRFGKYEGAGEAKLEEVTPQQKKGLNAAALTAIIYIIIIAIGFFTGLLSGENGAFIGSPLLKGLIPILFVLFCLCGLAYGFTAGTFKNAVDVNKAMSSRWLLWVPTFCSASSADSSRAYSTGQSLVHSLRSQVLMVSRLQVSQAFRSVSLSSFSAPSSTSSYPPVPRSGLFSLRSSFRCSCSSVTIRASHSYFTELVIPRSTVGHRCPHISG